MKFFSQPKNTLLSSLLGGLCAFAVGCVITVGEDGDAGAPDECGDLLTHSEQVGDECFCDAGYDWCTSDPSDFNCCKQTPKGVDQCNQPNNQVIGNDCFCAQGYDWCTNDLNDFSCCKSVQGENTGSDSGSQSGTGTGTDTGTETEGGTTVSETGGMICEGELQPPPASCDSETELAYCTSTFDDCVEESEYYTCGPDGVWQPADGDPDCELLGYDFSYGCVDNGELVEQLCGAGPGTPCSNADPDYCGDADVLNYCLYSKLGAVSCLEQCQVVGDGMGVTYDFGSCGEQEGEFKCLCCDLDEEGCGEEGTTGGSTGGSSTGG